MPKILFTSRKKQECKEKRLTPWSLLYAFIPFWSRTSITVLSRRKRKPFCSSVIGAYSIGNTTGDVIIMLPKLLLLDEPTIFLGPVIVDSMGEQIQRLKYEEISLMLAEQNVKIAMEVGDNCNIIDTGEVRFKGSFSELSKAEHLVKKYLSV